jgi:predicted hydrocarbon binding protein
MISVAALLTDNRVPGNYFAVETYIRSDLEMGLLENRQGDRLIALPETLIQAIYSGIEQEIGQASRPVLFNWGQWWGKNFCTRFCEQLSHYYDKPLAELAMVEFVQALKQCWVVHGWGRLELDLTYRERGFLLVKTWNSVFAKQALNHDQYFCHQPACVLEAGFLTAFFSQLTARELYGLQTTCESMGADCNRFVLGIPQRVRAVEMLVDQNSHETIIQALCA